MKPDIVFDPTEDAPELTMAEVRDRHRDVEERGGISIAHRRRLSDKAAFKPPPDRKLLREHGMDMRMIDREKHPTREGADRRARAMPWWSAVVQEAPFMLARWWIWIVPIADGSKPTARTIEAIRDGERVHGQTRFESAVEQDARTHRRMMTP